LRHIAADRQPGIFIYGGFVFLFVYAFTELMDRNPNAWIWELLKAGFGIGLILYTGDWFGSNKYFAYFHLIFIAYFLLSVAASFYFSFMEENGSLRFLGSSFFETHRYIGKEKGT
jgi:alkylglycerol monooxygenase